MSRVVAASLLWGVILSVQACTGPSPGEDSGGDLGKADEPGQAPQLLVLFGEQSPGEELRGTERSRALEEWIAGELTGPLGADRVQIADPELAAGAGLGEEYHRAASALGEDYGARAVLWGFLVEGSEGSFVLPYVSMASGGPAIEVQVSGPEGAAKLPAAQVRGLLNLPWFLLGDEAALAPYLQLVVGWEELWSGRPAEAEAALTRATASIGSDIPEQDDERLAYVTAFHLLAIAHLEQGAFSAALDAADRVVAGTPFDPTGYNTRVVARVGEAGRVDSDAIADLERSLELDPYNNPVGEKLVGALLSLAGGEARQKLEALRARHGD